MVELVEDETHMLMEEDVPSERNHNPNTRTSGVRKNYAQANFLALKLPQHDLDTRYILTQLQEEESFQLKQHSPRKN
jgi:hypothetical protein